jgi:predicted DNA-binding protein
MATSRTQVSAVISLETKERLERYARAHGLKKGFLIESALLHHLSALEYLPADVIVQSNFVVSRPTGERLLKKIAGPQEPTAAMKELFEDGSDGT